MNSQEKELLTGFLQDMTAAQTGQKDSEAATLIKEACARQPDAAYLLVQRAISLDQALLATQAHAQKLQAELDQARTGSSGGFLSDPNAWGSRANVPAQQNPGSQRIPGTGGPAAPGRQPIPGTAAAPATAAAAAPAQRSSWGGSGMMGNIAGAAVGVVAGSFLYQGIQGLMNRNDTQTASSTPDFGPSSHEPSPQEPEQYAASEPELLNSYDTPEDSGGDTFASGFGDSGDVG